MVAILQWFEEGKIAIMKRSSQILPVERGDDNDPKRIDRILLCLSQSSLRTQRRASLAYHAPSGLPIFQREIEYGEGFERKKRMDPFFLKDLFP